MPAGAPVMATLASVMTTLASVLPTLVRVWEEGDPAADHLPWALVNRSHRGTVLLHEPQLLSVGPVVNGAVAIA